MGVLSMLAEPFHPWRLLPTQGHMRTCMRYGGRSDVLVGRDIDPRHRHSLDSDKETDPLMHRSVQYDDHDMYE